jgi:undecaprenyl phosphate N,N'-diacetylbacillosamine 1-phosphate transferase
MYKHFFKRVFDFGIAFIILSIIWPFLLCVIILLYFSNEGTGVFFLQKRPGRFGKIFKVIKFKSMTDKKDDKGNLLPNEMRITKIGRFIRKTSVDELPQLFNVLKGDMSIIGPRPLMIRYLSLYSKEQNRRHEVRPGITGWAQVNGRNRITWTEKFRLDVWYVDNISLFLDARIMVMTINNIISRKDINSSNEKIGAEGFNGIN